MRREHSVSTSSRAKESQPEPGRVVLDSGAPAMTGGFGRGAAIAGIFAFGLTGASVLTHAQNAATNGGGASFAFGLFGDLAYSPAEEPLLANVLADLDRTPLAFIVHVGDLGSPRAGSCTQELWARRLAEFQAS